MRGVDRGVGRSTPPGALVLAVIALTHGAAVQARRADRSDSAVYASELEYCVGQTNEYRASVGLPALVRSVVLEAYAADAAPHDGAARAVHRYFRRTRGGGVAFAENQIPWWPLPQFGSIREIIRSGLAMMWAEGRGGGHYNNMTGAYAQAGCGVFVQGDQVTVVQAFR